jgi:hypothetical protein
MSLWFASYPQPIFRGCPAALCRIRVIIAIQPGKVVLAGLTKKKLISRCCRIVSSTFQN